MCLKCAAHGGPFSAFYCYLAVTVTTESFYSRHLSLKENGRTAELQTTGDRNYSL